MSETAEAGSSGCVSSVVATVVPTIVGLPSLTSWSPFGGRPTGPGLGSRARINTSRRAASAGLVLCLAAEAAGYRGLHGGARFARAGPRRGYVGIGSTQWAPHRGSAGVRARDAASAGTAARRGRDARVSRSQTKRTSRTPRPSCARIRFSGTTVVPLALVITLEPSMTALLGLKIGEGA